MIAAVAGILTIVLGVRQLLPRDKDPHASVVEVSATPQTLGTFRAQLRLEPVDAVGPRPVVVLASVAPLPLAQASGADAPSAPPAESPSAGDPGAGGTADPGAGGTADPSAGDPGTGDPSAGDPGTEEPGAGGTPGATSTNGADTPAGAATTTTTPGANTGTGTGTTTTAGPAGRSGTAARVLSPELPAVLPDGVSPERFRRRGEATLGLVPEDLRPQLEGCMEQPACSAQVLSALTGPEGEPLPPAAAAVRLTEMLRRTRTTETPSGPSPAGMHVAVKLSLRDLEGEPVLVTWQLLDVGAEQRLFGRWAGTNVSYRLVAESDRDQADLPLWVPLPRIRGPFVVRVSTHVGDERTDHGDSKPFG